MNNLKDYKEYESLFQDLLVTYVRRLLLKLENEGDYELEDSDEHNDLKIYFNEFRLWKKYTKKQWENRK